MKSPVIFTQVREGHLSYSHVERRVTSCVDDLLNDIIVNSPRVVSCELYVEHMSPKDCLLIESQHSAHVSAEELAATRAQRRGLRDVLSHIESINEDIVGLGSDISVYTSTEATLPPSVS